MSIPVGIKERIVLYSLKGPAVNYFSLMIREHGIAGC